MNQPLLKNRKKPAAAYRSTPGFFLRLAAILYDSLLLLGILFVATALVLPINNGVAFTQHQYLFSLYLLSICFIFFGWFWTHGGQTLGLKAWKLKVTSVNHENISWKQAFFRFLAFIISMLPLGIGFLWLIFDPDKRTLYDRISKTALFFDD